MQLYQSTTNAAILALQQQLAAEQSRAVAAEGSLTGQITTLTNQLSVEQSRAQAAEALASSSILGVESRAVRVESTITSNLVGEISRATAATAAVSTAVAAERSRAVSAEMGEVSRATAAESSLGAAVLSVVASLGSEISRAVTAETALTAAVALERSRAVMAETLLTANITGEIARATGAEASITAAVSVALGVLGVESSRALTAVAFVSASVSAERSRAERVEGVLSSNVTMEVVRAVAIDGSLAVNDASLATSVAKEASRAVAAENNLLFFLGNEINRAVAGEASVAAAVRAVNSSLSSSLQRNSAAISSLGSSLSYVANQQGSAQQTRISMIPASRIGVASAGAQTIAVGQGYTNIGTFQYTCVFSSSVIMVEYQTSYTLGGSGADTFGSQMIISGQTVGQNSQVFVGVAGGGSRSGTLFPLKGVAGCSTTASISVQVATQGTDDTFTTPNDVGTWLKIVEVPTQQIYLTSIPVSRMQITATFTPGQQFSTFASFTYNCVFPSSTIMVEFINEFYSLPGGSGADTVQSQLLVSGVPVSQGYQYFNPNNGGGTRSGVLFPLKGATNCTSPAVLAVQLNSAATDDTLQSSLGAGTALRITEIPTQMNFMKMIPVSGLGIASAGSFTVGAAQGYTPIATYVYTCVFGTSIIVEFDTKYTLSGYGADAFAAQITVGGTIIAKSSQTFYFVAGSGTRSGVLFPLKGLAPCTTSASISVQVSTQGTDDTFQSFNDVGTWLKITELPPW